MANRFSSTASILAEPGSNWMGLTIRILFSGLSSSIRTSTAIHRSEDHCCGIIDAEFGKAVAGFVTVQTKSGSNDIHGSGF